MLDIKGIEEIIPQRAPFLMIDKVEEFVPGESAVAYKNVNINEWYFQGHFPENPIMPGDVGSYFPERSAGRLLHHKIRTALYAEK